MSWESIQIPLNVNASEAMMVQHFYFSRDANEPYSVMIFEGEGVVGSPCPPSRSAHVFNAILNIKILLNGKNYVH